MRTPTRPSSARSQTAHRSFAASAPVRSLAVGLTASSLVFSLRAAVEPASTPFRVGEQPSSGKPTHGLGQPRPSTPERGRGELFFIDAAVADPRAFWLAAPRGATVVSIPAGVDSWQFMAQEAENFRELGAIHIISHGGPGSLVLNGRRYTAPDFAARSMLLRQLGHALSKNGDILIYGCDAGAGIDGEMLVSRLADLTGADVAASINPTGGRPGADWSLEITHGTIETPSVAPHAYDHALATITVTSNADSGAGTLRDAITNASAGDTIAFNAGMTITLTSGQLSIAKNLTINGDTDDNGTPDVTIDANYNSRVLSITTGSVTLRGLTLTKGLLYGNGGGNGTPAGGSALGAGISITGGTLTLSYSTISACAASGGGGGGNGSPSNSFGGGGGGGFSGKGGGTGGSSGSTGSGGSGGNGGGGSATDVGKGGSTTGGAAGNYRGYIGGSGGTAGTIGGGGGGGGRYLNGSGGAGGAAAGGMYIGAGATVNISNTTLSSNLGAGGGGGGGYFQGGGAGGKGVGAILNAGTLNYQSSTLTLSSNLGAGGGAGRDIFAYASAGASTNNISGTANSAYSPNTSPTFVGATTPLSINANTSATDLKSLLHASDTDSSQTLTWTQSAAPAHGTLSISSATASSGSSDITPGGTLTYMPTADYAGSDSFTVQVSDGTNSASRTISVTIAAVAPGAPTIGTATAGDAQASVTFTAPSSTGGASITSYTVTASPGGATASGASSPLTVTGLTNGSSYTFSVTATNSAGTSTASGASSSVTPKGAQTITFADPGTQNFGTSPTLSASASSGLSVSFTSSTPSVATVTSGGVLTFLSTGTATINADQAGNSAYNAASTVSRSFTVSAVAPGAPTIGTATAGDAQASVTFTAPSSTGGASITSYTATASPGGATASGASSPLTVTGLTNGSTYTFSVTANNSAGTSTASGGSNSVTPKGAQTITFADPGTQSFGTSPTLSASASSGLSVSFTSSTPSVATVTSGGVLTFLSTGTATINADQAGNSTFNAASTVSRSFTVSAVAPGAPTIGTATGGNAQASVTFTAPSSTGGASITSYTATASPGGATASGASSPLTVTGLTNGTSYTFSVTATNSAGTSTASGASNSVTLLAPPTVTDGNISISGGSGTSGAFRIGDTVTATWLNTSSGDNSASVSGVTVDFSQFGGGSTVTATNSANTWTASYTLTAGAIDAANRNIAVTATNSSGSTTTADTTNATVDSIAPTVSDARISLTGTTGTGGVFKTGDTLTATWNNTAAGDNNTDTIAAVTVDFSQFGGGSAVVATNASGTWTASYTLPAGGLSASNRNIAVTVTDNAGNATTTADTTNATVNTLTPAAPAITAISTDTGSSASDQVTTDTTLILSGTAPASSTITVSRTGAGVLGTTTSNGAGVWSYDNTASALSAGTFVFTATTTDAVGNVSAASADFTVTIDLTAPSTTIATAAFSADTGSSASDFITKTAAQTLSGTTSANLAANEHIEVSLDNGATWTTATSTTGTTTWSLSGQTLAGSNTLKARVVDAAGNAGSVYSQAYTLDTTAPATPAITAISSDTGTSASDLITSDATLVLSGTAEANATVTVSLTGTGSLGTTIADGSGAWTYDHTGTSLAVGSHTFTATATDSAGNVSPASSGTEVTIQTAPSITTQPSGGAFTAGDNVTLTVAASGTGPLSYQWYRASTALTDTATRTGSTTASLTLTGVTTVGYAGDYTVSVTNASGSVTSAVATVSITSASQTVTFPAIADQPLSASPLTVSATASSGLAVTFSVVSGPASVTGNAVTFTGIGAVTLRASQAGDATYSPANTDVSFTVYSYHSADTNGDWKLSLIELTRVIDLYNTRSGTTRTGDYHTQTGTEDGFAPGVGTLTTYHSADTDSDGRISLLELTRVIDLYNTKSGTTRTGDYHRQTGTEDGYAPGL